MKKIFLLFFTVFFIIGCNCNGYLHYIFIHQKEIILIYDDNKTMTASEKILNKEAGLISFSFCTELPQEWDFEIIVEGDKCINVKKLDYGNNIQITPIAAGFCNVIIKPHDISYGVDSCKITVKNKSEL